jgi:DNA ligase-1
VLEITYEEIQKSPTYSSGYALRFPRLVNLRIEKPADEASTLEMVEELYFAQRGRG